jgi:hypothetical protein
MCTGFDETDRLDDENAPPALADGALRSFDPVRATYQKKS